MATPVTRAVQLAHAVPTLIALLWFSARSICRADRGPDDAGHGAPLDPAFDPHANRPTNPDVHGVTPNMRWSSQHPISSHSKH